MKREEPSQPRSLLLCLLVVFTACALGSHWLAQSAGLVLFRTLAMLLGWAACGILAMVLPRWRFGLHGLAFLAAFCGLVIAPIRFYLPGHHTTASITGQGLVQMLILASALSFALYFLATFASHYRRESRHSSLELAVPLTRLVVSALLGALLVIGALVFFQKIWLREAEITYGLLTALLMAEEISQRIASLYLPKRLRKPRAFGQGLLLPLLFARQNPLTSIRAQLEKTLGIRMENAWLFLLVRKMAAPLLLLFLVGLWLSTSLTIVPVDSKGVNVFCGRFQSEDLEPGLHIHAPWPWGRVEMVDVSRIKEISIGFEKDLSRPILWAEKHFDGEQNLLVGGGAELLTVNMPIHYRFQSAHTALMGAAETEPTLTAMGYHSLLRITGSHDSFGLMTTERDEVAEKIRKDLQAELDRMQLGIQIVFLGLKDVHPPVQVAASYQDVVSAEEQKISLTDQAHTQSITTTSEAQITAMQTRIGTEASTQEKLMRVRAEAARFLLPAAIWQEHPAQVSLRMRMDCIEDAFTTLKQLYIIPEGVHQRTLFQLGSVLQTPPTSSESTPVIRPGAPVIRKINVTKP